MGICRSTVQGIGYRAEIKVKTEIKNQNEIKALRNRGIKNQDRH